MKELTLEQKAEAYDKALERMKSWVKGEHPECFTEAQKAAEFIFPELQENRDERIRKALILVMTNDFEESTTIDDITVGEIIGWLEKQGEQKPFDYENANIQQKDFAPKQSVKWSDKDEKMLEDACVMLDWYKGNNWWEAQYIKGWLESLKARIM